MEKENKIRLSFCKGDAVVISFVIMLAILIGVVFWMKTGREQGSTVVVYQEGEKVQEISLDKADSSADFCGISGTGFVCYEFQDIRDAQGSELASVSCLAGGIE